MSRHTNHEGGICRMNLSNPMRLITIITMKPHETLSINDKTYKTDADGKLIIDMYDMVAGGEKSFQEFDRRMLELLNQEQVQLLYEVFLNNNRVGKNEMCSILSIDKETVQIIFAMALKFGILRKVDTQWRMDYNKRELFKSYLQMKNEKVDEVVVPFKVAQVESSSSPSCVVSNPLEQRQTKKKRTK